MKKIHIPTKTPIFKPTAAATAKANSNTKKTDNKNIYDTSFIAECINNTEWNEYNHINLCAEFVLNRLNENRLTDGYNIISISLYPFKVVIESIPQTYCIYQDGRQKYKYHYFDNCRVNILHESKSTPILTAVYNDQLFKSYKPYIEIDV